MLCSVRGLIRCSVPSSLCARSTSNRGVKTSYTKDDYLDPDRIVNDSESYRKGIRLPYFGQRTHIMEKGFLPRDPEDKKPISTIPVYKPKKAWTPNKAFFGQNDYIDILGDGSIRPTDSMRGVPSWLRGFQGNEYQMLLLKRRQYYHWKTLRPQKYHDMNLRIKWLYHRLNFKTPT